jgi:hypothetical protein
MLKKAFLFVCAISLGSERCHAQQLSGAPITPNAIKAEITRLLNCALKSAPRHIDDGIYCTVPLRVPGTQVDQVRKCLLGGKVILVDKETSFRIKGGERYLVLFRCAWNSSVSVEIEHAGHGTWIADINEVMP